MAATARPRRDAPEGAWRVCWHPSARDLALALRREGTRARRLYVFDIPPRLMPGLYAAAFAGADATVHRHLGSYYDPAALRDECRPLAETARRLGVRPVDGRLEIGRNTGDLLHYFLANVEGAGSPGGVRARRAESRRAWGEAVQELAPPELRIREMRVAGAEPVWVASAERQHLLIRQEGAKGARAAALRRLGGGDLGTLEPEDPLHRDILGEWAEGETSEECRAPAREHRGGRHA
ncbi:MAG: hypothetical protein AB1578_14130 [Thermodesulfobacteriota bacterium]